MKWFFESDRNAIIGLTLASMLIGRYMTVGKRRLIFLLLGAALFAFGTRPEARYIGLAFLLAAIYSYIPLRNAYGMISMVITALVISYFSVKILVPQVDRMLGPIRRKLLAA